MSNFNKKALAAQGGGVLGIAFVGAMKEYVKQGGDINQFEYFAGSSAGSIFVTLMALRVPISKLYEKINDMDFKKFEDNDFGVVRDMYRMINKYGWNKGKALRKWIANTIIEFAKKDITFQELYDEYGSTLFVTRTKMELPCASYEVISRYNYPNKKISSVVFESCSIPLIYPAVVDNKNLFVDGGLMINYPIDILRGYVHKEEILGLKFRDTNRKESIENFSDYVKCMINTWMNLTKTVNKEDDYLEQTIEIDTYSISATSFDIDESQKKLLYLSGKNAMLGYLI